MKTALRRIAYVIAAPFIAFAALLLVVMAAALSIFDDKEGK